MLDFQDPTFWAIYLGQNGSVGGVEVYDDLDWNMLF